MLPLSMEDVAFCVEHPSTFKTQVPVAVSRRARHKLASAWRGHRAKPISLALSAARVESARRSARGTQGKAAAIGAATEALSLFPLSLTWPLSPLLSCACPRSPTIPLPKFPLPPVGSVAPLLVGFWGSLRGVGLGFGRRRRRRRSWSWEGGLRYQRAVGVRARALQSEGRG